MNPQCQETNIIKNRNNRVLGLAAGLSFCALSAMAVTYCACDHVLHGWGTGTTVCWANGYPLCGPTELDHVGCYYCSASTLVLPYSCEDGTMDSIEVNDCRTDDVGPCGELQDC